MKTFA
jgi:hypothetical protein